MKSFYEKGLNFKCQGSGKCCVSRGEYGFVYMTREDQKSMAAYLKKPLKTFRRHFTKVTDGVRHLIQPEGTDDCLFLKDKRCTVYEARPTQCRTWPFWSENLSPKAWQKNVVAYCPGASVTTKAARRSFEEIQPQVAEQRRADRELFE